MVVYVVAYGWDYEGEDSDSLRVFANGEDAQRYYDQWNAEREYPRYDYAVMLEREVL
jgi:hypothetical protein